MGRASLRTARLVGAAGIAEERHQAAAQGRHVSQRHGLGGVPGRLRAPGCRGDAGRMQDRSGKDRANKIYRWELEKPAALPIMRC